MPVLYTVGYGNLTPTAFFALLPPRTLLVDVRAYPDRARLAAFTRAGLSAWKPDLPVSLPAYTWLAELGNPSRAMPPRLASPERGLARLVAGIRLAEARGCRLCLLCAEGRPFEADGVTPRCHRVVVARMALQALEGLDVIHLGG